MISTRRSTELIEGEVESIVDQHSPEKEPIDYEALLTQYKALVLESKVSLDDIEGMTHDELVDVLLDRRATRHTTRCDARFPADTMERLSGTCCSW